MAEEVGKAVEVIVYGDGRDVPASKNTHPDNLAFIRDDIGTLRQQHDLMTYGDGKDVGPGADTHPYNLKRVVQQTEE